MLILYCISTTGNHTILKACIRLNTIKGNINANANVNIALTFNTKNV